MSDMCMPHKIDYEKECKKLEEKCMEKDHEIWRLRRTVEALEYLLYNCIPKDDRRKD